MEASRRQRRKPMSQINVVPMIDVMLVLLIVFMVTTSLPTQGIKVDLPKVDSKATPDDKDILVISISKDGKYFINLGKDVDENAPSVPLEKIGESVGKILNQNPTVPVYVEGDAANNYGVVVNLLETVRAAGATGVSLITQPPSGKK